jgi:LAS superfamily LD-carboxypeptidase LdcB
LKASEKKSIFIGVGVGLLVATIIVLILSRKKKKPTQMLEVEKTWDSKTDAKIQTLHPQLRGIASKFINEVEKKLGHRLRITDGYRTFAEQDKLYSKGRTTSGKKVTNARGGSSYHNYGLAFDTYFTENGKVTFAKAINSEVAKIGKELGLEWGGDWASFKDMPHFQLSKGSVKQLLALHNSKKVDSSGYVVV